MEKYKFIDKEEMTGREIKPIYSGLAPKAYIKARSTTSHLEFAKIFSLIGREETWQKFDVVALHQHNCLRNEVVSLLQRDEALIHD